MAITVTKTLYLIDGHAQIFRAYYARIPELTSPTGEPTKATHVFMQMLLNLIRDRSPDYLVMTMDVADSTVFRREFYPDYKATRDATPEDLPIQIERIASMVQLLGVPLLRLSGYEADDLMATIVQRLADEPIDIYLVSKDKDLEQLLSDRVRLYDPGKDEVVDPDSLRTSKGYGPEQAIEIQTLCGDTVDNIPGIPGVGVKTAAKLIAKYGSADAVVEHAAELTPKMAENVRGFAGRIELTRKLVTLKRDVEFSFDLDQARVAGFLPERLMPIFDELDMARMKDQWRNLDPASAPTPSPDRTASEGGSAQTATYHLVDTGDKLNGLASQLMECDTFAFDTETTGLNPVKADLVGLSFCWQEGEAYYVPVRSVADVQLPLSVIVDALRPVFCRDGLQLVGQNIKYDLVVLRQVGIEPTGPFFDTMIAAFLLDPMQRSFGMDAMALDLLGHRMIPITDLIGKGRDQIPIDEVNLDRVCEYACEDADYTWQLRNYLKPRLESSPALSLFRETEMPLVEVLATMEHNGVALDAGMLATMSKELTERLAELTTELHHTAEHEFNIDSTKQLANVLFDEQQLPVIRKTKTGRSTDADTLSELVRRTDNPIPKLLLEYRELKKLKSTYVDTLPEMVCSRTGRIHTSFNPIGAITGRLSSSNPNLQNIPIRTELGRKIRGAFVAQSGEWVILAADYSQIELRVLAHFCQDGALLQAFRDELDIHSAVAAQIYGVALEDVNRDQRGAAKAVNFGIIYGQTAFGLARSLNIGRSEAESFITMYFMRYPGIRMFIDKCIADAKQHGYVETILGRRRPVPELNSRNKQQVAAGERVAVNTVIQGSAADLIKRAMIDIHNALRLDDYSSRMLIQVHDELVFETPSRAVEAEAEMIRDKMVGAIPLDVPVQVDIAWGPNWLECK